MCPASPAARVVEGLAGETNTPSFVPHSSATAVRPRPVRYFPAPLLSFPSAGPKRSPSSLPGLHTPPPQDLHTAVALSTQPSALRGERTPHNAATNHNGGEKDPREHTAACNAVEWATMAKPFPQQTATQRKLPSPAPCRGYRVNI